MASTHAHARSAWSGKWAFILAAAASAVGLGNMWRFPYLAAKYGGGTFLLTYLVLVFTFGVSLLLLETALGRKTGQSAIGAFKQSARRRARVVPPWSGETTTTFSRFLERKYWPIIETALRSSIGILKKP